MASLSLFSFSPPLLPSLSHTQKMTWGFDFVFPLNYCTPTHPSCFPWSQILKDLYLWIYPRKDNISSDFQSSRVVTFGMKRFQPWIKAAWMNITLSHDNLMHYHVTKMSAFSFGLLKILSILWWKYSCTIMSHCVRTGPMFLKTNTTPKQKKNETSPQLYEMQFVEELTDKSVVLQVSKNKQVTCKNYSRERMLIKTQDGCRNLMLSPSRGKWMWGTVKQNNYT